MRTLGEADLLAWAEDRAMGLDQRYPNLPILTFRPDPGHDRFWSVAPKPERQPRFITSLLDLAGEWRSCFVWKALGSWPASANPQRINDVIQLRILRGLGLPLGTAGAVEFARSEIDSLVTLLFSTTIFGWSVGDDTYVIPDKCPLHPEDRPSRRHPCLLQRVGGPRSLCRGDGWAWLSPSG